MKQHVAFTSAVEQALRDSLVPQVTPRGPEDSPIAKLDTTAFTQRQKDCVAALVAAMPNGSDPVLEIWQASMRCYDKPENKVKVSTGKESTIMDAEAFEKSLQGATSKPHAVLIFSRHGESEWNVANKFTGWVDVDLSEKGVAEAQGAGDLIKDAGYRFDVCYTSFLKRAIKTLELALEKADQLFAPVFKTWRLNERMYGALTGLDKKETVVKHGADQVLTWRRSFDLPPPEIDEDSEYNPKKEAKYASLKPEEIPKTESLKTVIERVLPYWEETIKPDLKAGKTVFVCAHGNSIRAIVKYLENIPDDVIPGLEIPTATPLVYELDSDLNPIVSDQAVAPLKCGRYLGDAEAIKAAAEAVKNQTKVG